MLTPQPEPASPTKAADSSGLFLCGRVCTRCGLAKPLDAFRYEPRRGKYLPRCRECENDARRSRYADSPEQHEQTRARWARNAHKRTPEKRAAERRRRGETPADLPYITKAAIVRLAAEKREARARARAERLARPRKPETGSREWRAMASAAELEAYRDRTRIEARRYYATHPERERERSRLYKHANPERVMQWQGKRTARAAERDDGTMTREAMGTLFAKAKRCPYCGTPLTADNRSLDHIIALALGGAHSIVNALVCCVTCNNRKRAKPFDAWLAEIEPQYAERMRAEYHRRFRVAPAQRPLELPF